MLSPLDAELWRRDRALPGLATVLDPEALVHAVSRALPSFDLKPLRIAYVRHKLGRRCTVTYRAGEGLRELEFFATAYSNARTGKLRRACEQPSVPGPFGPGRVILERIRTLVTFHPNDSRLGAMLLMHSAESRRRFLQRLLPDRPELWDADLERLRYRPERRFVAKLMSGNEPRAVIRLYTERDYPRARRALSVLTSRGKLRVARLIGWSDTHHAIALEWLPGRLLRDCILIPHPEPETVANVGAALADLHGQDPGPLPQRTRRADGHDLVAAADAVRFIEPRLARRAEKLAQHLGAQLMEAPALNGPIHGDFHAKQVLVDEFGVAIIDLDQAARGDCAADLGLFVAHLERDALRGELAADQVVVLRRALLKGYGEARRLPSPARIDMYVAGRLLRRLPYCFRHREPGWTDRMEALLRRAEAVSVGREPPGDRGASMPPNARGAGAALDVPVIDPFGVAGDPKMPFLADAIEPALMRHHLRRPVRAIRVQRYKPGRRCLIEYELDDMTLLGKVHAKGLDETSPSLMESLRHAGFDRDSEDGICVPRSHGVITELQMWLQEKVPGIPATNLLARSSCRGTTDALAAPSRRAGPIFPEKSSQSDPHAPPRPQGRGLPVHSLSSSAHVVQSLIGPALATRIAQATHKLHRAGVSTGRRHTLRDELRILRERLRLVAEEQPQWTRRLDRVMEACDRLGAAIPQPVTCGIHRDFYADHVLVDGGRLYLVDFDLYCDGDPALDVGNFIAHLTEQSLRTLGDPGAMKDREQALEQRFVELSGADCRLAVSAYTALTLVRHIHISRRLADRRPFTSSLLELCEARLDVKQKNRQAIYSQEGPA